MKALQAPALRLLVAFVVGAALGWWLPATREPSPGLVSAARSPWLLEELPKALGPASQLMAAQAVNAGFWGVPEERPAAAPPPEDLRWRAAAIVGVGGQRQLMIVHRAGTKPAQMARVGDATPSGHRIVEIGETTYCVEIGGRSYRLGVERGE